MNKTIREHLNDLPEPYRTEALDNFENPLPEWVNVPKEVEDVKRALNEGFSWASSPQGFEYWNEFYNSL